MCKTSIAKANINDTNKVEKSLTQVEIAGKYLRQIADDVLDLTKIEKGRMKPHFEETSITELINEHEIMQQAYAQANEVVTLATNQAQEILDNATIEANTMREAAMHYTDDLLANVENIIAHSMENASFRYEELMKGLNECYDIVKNNRAELFPMAGLEDLEDDVPSSNEPAALDII